MKYVYKKKAYVFFFSVLDALGGIISLPAKYARKGVSGDVKRILLIRSDHIGDVIAATAVLGPLREAYPEAVIDLMAPSFAEELLGSGSPADHHVVFDAPWFSRKKTGIPAHVRGFAEMVGLIKMGGYDVAVDLRGDVRHIAAMSFAGVRNRISYGITGGGFLLTCRVPYEGTLHETERNMALLEPLGVKRAEGDVRVIPSAEAREDAKELLQTTGINGKYAVIHVVPGHPSKRWDTASFAKVARHLKKNRDLTPVLVGAPDNRGENAKVAGETGEGVKDLCGRTDLAQLGALIESAELFVGVDSGPSHISAAVGTPSVVVFGGINDPFQWAPRGDNVRVVCPGKEKNLSTVTADDVIEAIEEVLG